MENNTTRVRGENLIPLCIGQDRYMKRNQEVYNEMTSDEQLTYDKRSFGLAIYNSVMNVTIGALALVGLAKLTGVDKLFFN